MADTPQHCIVTALSRERLEELVAEHVRRGWRRRGDVAVAKSVIRDEPAYFCQSMCRDVVRAWDEPEQKTVRQVETIQTKVSRLINTHSIMGS